MEADERHHSGDVLQALNARKIAIKNVEAIAGRSRAWKLGQSTPLLVVSVLLAGCGVQYRPVLSAINPVGPASQPTKYAVAVSNPSPVAPGLLTFVDVSGDTVLSTPSILPDPNYFVINNVGSEGFTINSVGTFEDFPLSNPTGLRTTNIVQTALAAHADPITISPIAVAGSSAVFIPEPGLSEIAALGIAGSSLLQSISVGDNPIYVVGADGTPRVYAISQGSTAGGFGEVAAIEGSTFSISSTIPVGITPVYGVMTADTHRTFILNQGSAAVEGSGTVSVINTVNNAPDVAVPVIMMPDIILPGGGTTAPRPIWADLSTVNSQLVVLNQGDGIHPGSLTIINIPLCNAGTQGTNPPNCDATNPVDATSFGTIAATVNVGVNPTMVSVLSDGSRAYVANSGNAGMGIAGSISVVNLISDTVTATIASVADDETCAILTSVTACGHPSTIATTAGTPTGKVYITSPDSTFLTILRTDIDGIQTHIGLQGLGLRVMVTVK